MQSTHSKLFMAGLVAAHSAAALEIKETGLVSQAEQATTTVLAQVHDDPDDENEPPPDNANSNKTDSDEESESELPSNDEIADKVGLMTEAQIDGLDAKSDYIIEKLTYWRAEQYQLLCDIDKSCRSKILDRKETSATIISNAMEVAVAGAKECRVEFVDELLKHKEQVKGKLEELLNHTIQAIKEMKVEGILNEAGVPTEEHKHELDLKIEQAIADFNTDSLELLGMGDGNSSTGFLRTCYDELQDFEVTLRNNGSINQPSLNRDED